MAEKRTFHVYTAVRTVGEFAKLADQAAVLKKHGPVEIMVSSLAEPTRADVPPGGSPWHDYTKCLPTWRKFFPHPKMAPFLDMAHVKKNRALLAASVKVLRKHGYQAAFSCHTPFFLPEEFFAKHPHLRGARCDHPRRSRQEAFALCVDHPETLAMYAEMAAQMRKDIPELSWLRLMSNDAGAGFCWADWLYPGPNGPASCRHISTGQRVIRLTEAIRKGFGEDKKLDIACLGNFSDAETRELQSYEHDGLHVQQHFKRRGHPYQIVVGSLVDNPVRGIFDPVGMVKSLERWREPVVKRVSIDFRFNYSRGHELEDVQEKVIEVVEAFAAAPAYGVYERTGFLRKLCAAWVGQKRKDELLEALFALHEALTVKKAAAEIFTTNYCGVSMRAIDRPLVIMPELLSPEEESYFLPHVFNPSVPEARTDYLDWHGGRIVGGAFWMDEGHRNPRVAALDRFCESLRKVAGTLSDMGGTPAGEVLVRMGISLRLYACVMRSVNNMFALGTVRARNLDKLGGPAHLPPKVLDWAGDPDLQLMIGFMRDELDNAGEMIGLLENGGRKQMLLADHAEDEDTFLLGPDLIGNLRKKCAIMRKHWVDAQAHMTIPHK